MNKVEGCTGVMGIQEKSGFGGVCDKQPEKKPERPMTTEEILFVGAQLAFKTSILLKEIDLPLSSEALNLSEKIINLQDNLKSGISNKELDDISKEILEAE